MAEHKFTTWQELFKLKQQFLVSLFTPKEIRNEEWRDVVGYEGVYSVSNLGRVRRDLANSNAAKAGRIRRPGKNRGYLRVVLCKDGRDKNISVHKLVAAAFIGPCPEGMQVNHIKQPKSNNRVGNLEYVTPEQNRRHAMENGLMPTGDRNGSRKYPERLVRGKDHHWQTNPEGRLYGDRNPSRTHPERLRRGDSNPGTKLKDEDVPRIFELRKLGMTYSQIGKAVSLCKNQVGNILTGKSRKPFTEASK